MSRSTGYESVTVKGDLIMSGIGFELRKYLDIDSRSGTLKAYKITGLVSAGPWMLSILGLMLIGLLALPQGASGADAKSFTTSVIWMIGASMILTGVLQLMFARFIADRLFESKEEFINPNLLGAILLTTAFSGVIGIALVLLVFHGNLVYEMLMISNFVVLCNIWIIVVFAATLKRFKLILTSFAAGYSVTVAFSLFLTSMGHNGLLIALLLGHGLILFTILGIVMPEYPVTKGVRLDFLKRSQITPALVFIGVCYNLGFWVDKLIFWLVPETSETVIEPLRASLIYDLPIFLAYISVIPGMAVFLLRVETDFTAAYESFSTAISGNASAREIEKLGNEMVLTVRDGLFQVAKIQGVAVMVFYLLVPSVISMFGFSRAHAHVFYIDLVGVAAQVVMLAVLSVFFYLDKLRSACILCLVLLVSNTLFSFISIDLGPDYYGYGFGLSMIFSAVLGVLMLARELERFEFHTFMRTQSSNALA